MIGAVVPVYNRRENLEMLLASLERQTTKDFHVVVADDGSTDGTREMIDRIAADALWRGRLRHLSCGPNQGVRTGRARNLGAANLEPGTTLLLMLDSDLILRPDAVEAFAHLHRRYPRHVLYGAVEWLPPLDAPDVMAAVREGATHTLRSRVPRAQPVRIEGTFTGPELRIGLFEHEPDQVLALRPEWALPLNSGWPLEAYWAAGGFDETMTGYGFQDMELGARAAATGVTCLARPDLWALHVWHPKPAKAMRENQRNLDRYLRRNGPNGVSEIDVDYSYWFHYHAERGGSVLLESGELWAVSADRAHRIRLPDTSWLPRLGHCPHLDDGDNEQILDRAADHGIASE